MSQLVPLTHVLDDGDNSVVHIRSLSLEGAWTVPLTLVQMEVHDIIRLALAVSDSTSTYSSDRVLSSTSSSVQIVEGDGAASLRELSAAICASVEQPSTPSEALTLQDYQALMALGSVFALVKYWAFMRMLWRHSGESDRIVISVMSHSENMKQPAPLRNAKNRKRWTVVRHGLNLMEILLNNRTLLLEVMRSRHFSFTNLICLRSDFLTYASLLRLVEKTHQLTRDPHTARQSAPLSLATLSALCEEAQDAPPTLAGREQQGKRGTAAASAKLVESSSNSTLPIPTASTSATILPSKKRKHSASSRKSSSRNDNTTRTSLLAPQQEEEKVAHDDVHRHFSDSDDDSKHPPAVANHSPAAQPKSSPLTDIHSAVLRMASISLVDYYYHLLKKYPQHVSVAAPLHYDDVELHQQMVSHRLSEHCSSGIALYSQDFLLNHSERLRRLPALAVGRDGHRALLPAAHDRCASTKVWVFVCDGSEALVKSVFANFSAAQGNREQWPGQPLLPTEVLLQHGMHLLLVFQREGETVALPSCSSSKLLLIQCMHDVAARSTLSTRGSFCSQIRLLSLLSAMPTTHSTYEISEKERFEISLPSGVFTSSPLSQPVKLLKPTRDALHQAMQVLNRSCAGDQATVWPDLESTEQLLYLLDQTLSHLARCSALPPPQLLPALHRLCSHPALKDEQLQAVLLALLTKVVALHSSVLATKSFAPCSALLGCSSGAVLPNMIVVQDAAPMVVFCYSEPYSQPLLYSRVPASGDAQQMILGADFYEMVVNRGEPCMYTTRTPISTSLGTHSRSPCCDARPSDFTLRELEQHTGDPSPVSAHILRSSQVISIDVSALSRDSVRASLMSALNAFLPSDLVEGGALKWCQARVHEPSYHLFTASDLATASQQIRSVPVVLPTSTHGLGWYDHMVRQTPREGPPPEVSLASVREAGKRLVVEELYGLCTELTSLVQAADAVEESNQCLLSPFVSTSYGELNQFSVQKVIECMAEHGLRTDALFLDVGCCYCKALVHVAYVAGINVYGVEAVRERSERGRRCVQRWKASHPDLAKQTGGIEIFAGDIIHNLHWLFPATHVLVLDASFMQGAKNVLKHLWGHMADSKLQMVFTCTPLDDMIHPMKAIARLQVSTGEENFTLYAYKVSPGPQPVGVEVFRSPVHGLGLRAARDFSEGEIVLNVVGERSASYSTDDRWPWMMRQPEEWIHVENLARFVNWHHDQTLVNVRLSTDADGTLRLQTSCSIRRGEELLSSPSCWASCAADELHNGACG